MLLKMFCRGFNGVMSQSTRGHRLSMKAYKLGGQKLQLPVLCALYKVHLGEGKDIEDPEILGEIAESTGVMSKQEVGDHATRPDSLE